MNGSCRDLEISICQHPTGRLQLGLEGPIDSRDFDVVREHRQRGQHSCLDVPQVARSVCRTICALEEFTHHDRARELLGAGNAAEPSHVPWQWTASQDFGDRVGVEEEGQSVEWDQAARSRTSHFR